MTDRSTRSRSNGYGIAVEGRCGAHAVARLARLAELHGYASFWFNVTPDVVDPVRTLAGVLAATSELEVGVGVIPLDAHPVDRISAQLAELGPLLRRCRIGVGVGRARLGSLRLAEVGVTTLRTALPDVPVVLAAVGPRMLSQAATQAHGVLLGMVPPEDAAAAIRQVSATAATAGRAAPTAYLYHRVARGPTGGPLIRAQMRDYGVTADGPTTVVGTVADAPDDVRRDLTTYPIELVPLLRPLTQLRGDEGEQAEMLTWLAPA